MDVVSIIDFRLFLYIMNKSQWFREFRVAALQVARAEKPPKQYEFITIRHDLPEEEKERIQKAWKAESKWRGYNEREVAEFSKRLDLLELGFVLGVSKPEIFAIEQEIELLCRMEQAGASKVEQLKKECKWPI